MKKISKCGLFVALFAVFSIVSSGVFSSDTYAASIYDNVYNTVDSVYLEQSPCPVLDIGLSWSESVEEESFWDAVDNGSWGVSQVYNSSPRYNQVAVYWVPSGQGEVIFQETYPGTPEVLFKKHGGGNIHWGIINQDSNCDPVFSYIGVQPSVTVSTHDTYYPNSGWANYFVSNAVINYPLDYEGEPIPDRANGQTEPDQFLYPTYEYTILNGKLRIKHRNNLPHFLTGMNTIVIEKWDFNWETGTNEIIETVIADPAGWTDETIDLSTSGAGYYTFRITHSQQLDSPPWEANANELYYIAPIFIRVNWDGSSNISGTTAGCEGEICGDKKDGDTGSNPIYEMFKSLSNIELHGLTQFILAPINFIVTLPSQVSQCSGITYPLFGTTQTLPCLRTMYSSTYPVIYNLWQTIVNGVVIGLISLNLFRIVKNINTPTHDGIEVARL